MLTAIILSIGDELTLGQTVDTNSAWLSQQLAAVGVRILAHATVPDDQPSIEEAIRRSARADVLLISGGLGPTEDDLTRQALAAVLNVPLELNEPALATLTAWFARLKRPMAESNKIQVMFPRGTTPIENTAGTAPGIYASLGSEISSHTSEVFIMPGVPKEMRTMFQRDILPRIQTLLDERGGGGAAILSRTLHTFGVGESNVGERLGDLMTRGRNPSVGTTVSGGVVSVRINSYFDSRERALEELERTTAAARERLGNLVYGQDDDTLPALVAKLLLDARQTVTTAESCTGGLLAKMLTDIPGSSAYFKQGWVTYSNEAKIELLGVDAGHIQGHGAVSVAVAREMAVGAMRRAAADFALAISGIAGPGGGTPEKPVGTVCIALAHHKAGTPDAIEAHARMFTFPGDRDFIRDRSAKMALTFLRFHLLNQRLPF